MELPLTPYYWAEVNGGGRWDTGLTWMSYIPDTPTQVDCGASTDTKLGGLLGEAGDPMSGLKRPAECSLIVSIIMYHVPKL